MLRSRAGFTLAELTVVMLVGSLVIVMLASVSSREQRFHRTLALAVARAEQLQQTEALLPVEFRSMAPGEGDILPGGARDTAIQFRATLVSGVACDTAGQSVSLAPTTLNGPALLSVLTTPVAGDTLWAVVLIDSGEVWYPHAITSVATDHGGCVIAGVDVLNGAGSASRMLLRIAASAGTIGPGTPVRVTRPRRYSLYKSSDAKWYLGDREWNPTNVSFDAIQPVSGPFRSPSQSGLVFRYLDTIGGVVSSGSAATRGIALVQVTIRSDSDGVIVGRQIFAGESRTFMSIGLRNRIR